MGLAFGEGYFGPPDDGNTYVVADSNPEDANAFCCLTNPPERDEELVQYALDVAAVVASSSPMGDVLAAFGGPGGWWTSVGEARWIEFALPAPATLSRIDIMCANADASPQHVEVSKVDGCRKSTRVCAWPFVVGDTSSPYSFTLDPPQTVTRFKLELHGIQRGHYVGVNSITFYTLQKPLVGLNAIARLFDTVPESYHGNALEILKREVAFTHPPSEAHPLTIAADRRQAFSVIAKCSELPACDTFPGAAGADAVAETVHVSIRRDPKEPSDYPGWVSTHVYVNPGQELTVEVDGSTESHQSWTLQIGCHTDDLTELDAWHRYPCIVQSFPLESASMTVKAKWGGLVFFVPHADADSTPFDVTLSNVICAPHCGPDTGYTFVDGAAPWGEVSGEKVAFCLPRDVIVSRVQSLGKVAKWWDRVIESHHALTAPPYGHRKERFVVDVQLSLGCTFQRGLCAS
jgi:hypothetical protein